MQHVTSTANASKRKMDRLLLLAALRPEGLVVLVHARHGLAARIAQRTALVERSAVHHALEAVLLGTGEEWACVEEDAEDLERLCQVVRGDQFLDMLL